MKGIDYLNQVITILTCSHCAKSEEFKNLTILQSLKQIRKGAHKELVLWLRSLNKDATQTKRKKELPVIFYSGMLSLQGDGNIQAYSGVVISETDVAQDSVAARRELVANPHVLAILRSVRGKNYSVLVPVTPVPSNQEEYEAASQQVFAMLGSHIVRQGKDNAKRFRTASYDPDLFINPDSVPFPVDYSKLNEKSDSKHPALEPETISTQNRERSIARLAGSLLFKRTSLSGLETALHEMNKTLFKEPLPRSEISKKAHHYFNHLKPRPGETAKHFQARVLKYSIPHGDGQSGKPPEVRVSNIAPQYLEETAKHVEKAAPPHPSSAINENPISMSNPGPDEYTLSDFDSVFYAELDKISMEYKYVVNVHLYQQLVRPLIVSLFSAHESIILRLSTAIRDRINRSHSDISIELTLEDLVGDFFFDKAKKYFEHVLKCPFDMSQSFNQNLRDLGAIRNVIVHQHSWIDKGKNKELYSRIENGLIQGVTLRYGELVIRIDYAVSAVNLIMEHLQKLIALVKKRYPIMQGHTAKPNGHYVQQNQGLSELSIPPLSLTN